MSREIGSGQTTEQRLATHSSSFSASPPTACRWCLHVGGVASMYRTATGFAVGRSAVCKRPRPRSMLAMPRSRPHKGTLFSDVTIVTRHSWPHRSPWRCMMRVAAASCKRHRKQFPR